MIFEEDDVSTRLGDCHALERDLIHGWGYMVNANYIVMIRASARRGDDQLS